MNKVLIVEDETVLQDVYKLVLNAHGYDVTVANNGMQGLTKLRETKPDLILLDLFMPIMDGREFLRNFNKSTFPKTKIIVYTNLSDSKTKDEMIELGADSFVVKSSMTPADLTELVDSMLTA